MDCSSLLTPPTSFRNVHSRDCLPSTRGSITTAFFAPKPLRFTPLPNLQKCGRTSGVVLADSQVTSTLPASVEFASAEETCPHLSSSEPSPSPQSTEFPQSQASELDVAAQKRRLEKELRRQSERTTYLFAAIASSVGITFLAAGAVYYRFAWHTQGADVPLIEILATFSLAVGASVGMEYWARWAHKALWHDSLWSMHESHHRPRDGPFEMNDVFAIINAVPAIALMAYGFFHTGLVPGLCFGAGLGITVFGMAYMFVHDGLVHRRFPVGPVANVPYLQKVAAAHQLHHADKFEGVPFGLFLGPQELEVQAGGAEELEKTIQIRKKLLAADY